MTIWWKWCGWLFSLRIPSLVLETRKAISLTRSFRSLDGHLKQFWLLSWLAMVKDVHRLASLTLWRACKSCWLSWKNYPTYFEVCFPFGVIFKTIFLIQNQFFEIIDQHIENVHCLQPFCIECGNCWRFQLPWEEVLFSELHCFSRYQGSVASKHPLFILQVEELLKISQLNFAFFIMSYISCFRN